METGYSLSDISAVTGAMNGGFGGTSVFTLLLVFALLTGGFGGWGNRGDYGQFATAASQQEVLFNQHFNNLDNKMDRGFTSIGNGIADATFALNNSIKDGNYATQTAIKDCCCTTQRNIDAVRYDMAQMFANSNAQHTTEIQQVKDLIKDNKIESLQGRINQLELQNAMCGVVRYPNEMSYCAGRSPFCNCGNCGNCGCGNI